MSPHSTAIVKPHYTTSLLYKFNLFNCRVKSSIYNHSILHMTEKWYRAFLERMEDGAVILDVGIGTAGALLRCRDLIESKNLKIIGIDIDDAYVKIGKLSVQEAGLSDRITIDVASVYDGSAIVEELAKEIGATPDVGRFYVDAVYFSGSFSLLPDPVAALKLVSTLVKKNDKGTIYITQTYQRKKPFFLPFLKPLLKYLTTIDFGQCITEEEIMDTFEESGLGVMEHSVIPGSIDTRFQAAYLSILKQGKGKLQLTKSLFTSVYTVALD